jgi:nucleoside-diphosphate-sugar epimerase
MKNKVLLLGYGFIGFSIARALLEDVNYELYVVDRNFKIFLMKNDRITYIQENVFNYDNWIDQIPAGVDCLINCISNNEVMVDFSYDASDAAYWQQAITDEKALVDTLVVISNKLKIKKIIYFSSRLTELGDSLVFGHYKNLIEQYIKEMHYPIYIFRLPILFGVFQDISQWPANLIWSVLNDENMVVNDNKCSVYPWLYVADAVTVIIQQINTLDINNKTLIMTGRELSIGLFAELILKLSGKMKEVTFSDTRKVNKLADKNNSLNVAEEWYEHFDERIMLSIEFTEDNIRYYENLKNSRLIRC